jgi:competence protein ComGC
MCGNEKAERQNDGFAVISNLNVTVVEVMFVISVPNYHHQQQQHSIPNGV